MRLAALTAALISLLTVQGISADLVIDDFSAGDPLPRFGLGTADDFTEDLSILGGRRDESITVTDQGGRELFGIIGFGGTLKLAQGLADEIKGSLTYDRLTLTDLTEGGLNNVFRLQIIGSDIDADLNSVLSVTVSSDTATDTQFFSVPASSSLPESVYINFSSFAGVDFTRVETVALKFDFVGNPGRDLEIGQFSAAVPEPTGAFVIGIIVAGWLPNRRQRR